MSSVVDSGVLTLQSYETWLPFDPHFSHLDFSDPFKTDEKFSSLQENLYYVPDSNPSTGYSKSQIAASDIVADAFRSATSSTTSSSLYPDYGSAFCSNHSVSPTEDRSFHAQNQFLSSPVSSIQDPNTDHYFQHPTSCSQSPPGNETSCFNSSGSAENIFAPSPYQDQLSYDVSPTSSEMTRHNDLDIDSDDLLKVDFDLAFYDYGDDFTGDLDSFKHDHSTNPSADKLTKARAMPLHRKRSAANQRERKRMQVINDGFDKLRKHLPCEGYEKKLSKVDTLKSAIDYISFMAKLLKTGDEGDYRKPKKKIVVFSKVKGGDAINRDLDIEDNVVGHSLSWTWEDNELPWSPSPSTTRAEETDDAEKETNRSKKNDVFRRSGSQKRKKQVRAKLWNPKFPGEKTTTEEEGVDGEKQAIPLKHDKSQTKIDFKAEQYAQQNVIGQSYCPSSIMLQTVYPVREQNISQTQERVADISPPNSLLEHNLPPVASLIGCNQQHSQAQSTSDYNRPADFNFSAFDPNFSNTSATYTNSEAIDRLLWNENETIPFVSPVRHRTISFC